MTKVLVHACCAVCSAHPIEKLREMGFEPVLYFFNPNIFPPEEFDRRLNELINYAEKKQVELIVDKQSQVHEILALTFILCCLPGFCPNNPRWWKVFSSENIKLT